MIYLAITSQLYFLSHLINGVLTPFYGILMSYFGEMISFFDVLNYLINQMVPEGIFKVFCRDLLMQSFGV